jgi:hypothetical protein
LGQASGKCRLRLVHLATEPRSEACAHECSWSPHGRPELVAVPKGAHTRFCRNCARVPARDPSRVASCAQLTCQGLLQQIGVGPTNNNCSASYRQPRTHHVVSVSMRAWCGCSTTWRTSILNQTADRGARVQQFQEVAADLVISVGFGLVAPRRSLDRRMRVETLPVTRPTRHRVCRCCRRTSPRSHQICPSGSRTGSPTECPSDT